MRLGRATNGKLVALVATVALVAATACLPEPPPICDGDPPFDLAGSPEAPGPDEHAAGPRELAQDPDCPPPGPPPGPPGPPAPPGPPDDCEGCGDGSGDPHLRTFDGERYDLQSAGELVASRASGTDADFEVQWRMEPFGTAVSSITSVATSVDGDRITITAGEEPVRVNGESVEIPDGDASVLDSGATVYREGSVYTVVWPDDGPFVVADNWDSFINSQVWVPDELAGQVEGLLGNRDGDPEDDLVLPDGTPIPDPPEFDDLYPDFAEAWLVTDETSLFDYDDGDGPDTYWDPDFPAEPVTLDSLDPEARAEAEEICREAGVTDPDLLENCILDVAVTGDATYAEATAALEARVGARSTGTTGATWAAILDGYTWRRRPVLPDGAGQLLVQTTDESSELDALVALDTEDGSVRWVTEEIAQNCSPAIHGDRIIAMTGAGSSIVGEDNPSAGLVAVDPADGTLLDEPRLVPEPDVADERLPLCEGALVAAGDTVVASFRSELVGFDADTLEPRWRRDLGVPARTYPVVSADGDGVWITYRDDAERSLVVELIDPDTGDAVASTELDEALPAAAQSLLGHEDGLLLMVGLDDPDAAGALLRLDRSGDDLDIDWTVELGTEDGPVELGRPTGVLAIAGDTVVSYTDGAIVSAFELGTGELAWSYEASSFNNNGWQVVGDEDGNAYLASFGGLWAESVDDAGVLRWGIDEDEVFTGDQPLGVEAIGPLVDGLVIAASSADNSPVIVGLPTEGL